MLFMAYKRILSQEYYSSKSPILLSMEEQPQEYADEYAILSHLGDGGQATVYLGKKNAETVALKIYHMGASRQLACSKEVDILRRIEHINLIRMFDHRPQARFKINHHNEERRPLIVLELAQGGELFDYLTKTGLFKPELARYYIKQLIEALAYMHSIGITHRDLKPENILFDSNFTLKVSDFGLARDSAGDQQNGVLTSRVGTEGYKAPQVDSGNYEGLKSDLFAVGVILFILCTAKPPFLSSKPHDQHYRIIRNKNYPLFWQMHERNRYPGFFSDSFKRLVSSLLSADPERRSTLEELRSDEWLNGEVPSSPALIAEMSGRAVRMGLPGYQRPNLERMRSHEEYRSDLNLDEESTTKEEVFTYNYFTLKIKQEGLPKYDLKNVTYAGKDVNQTVSWITSYLFEQKRLNNYFLEDSQQQIKFLRYSIDVIHEKAELIIKLDFQLNKQDETQLVLQGNLHQSSLGMIGIYWIKVEGNSLWLSHIQFSINESLKALN